MCNECERLFLDSSTNLYCCGFWSSEEELVAIDSIPIPCESFDEETRVCKFRIEKDAER